MDGIDLHVFVQRPKYAEFTADIREEASKNVVTERKFCNDKCRMNWWNTHRELVINGIQESWFA